MAKVTLKDNVIMLLTKYPSLQNSDERLVLAYWHLQDPQLKLQSYIYFQQLFLTKKLALPDVITRARRAVQEENEELRGSVWYQRHHLGVDMKSKENRDNKLFS